jgi:ring-1,2-phenylacetyl-CoA epoxidase subunit PaaE
MATTPIDRITRIPDPSEQVPVLAWPTLSIFAGGYALWIAAAALYLTDTVPWMVSVPLNAIASFVLFTVAHDSAHHSLSSNTTLNTWLGRLATPMFALHAPYRVWRFIHMQHHRHTNHDDGSDPDHYCVEAPRWQLPLRWATIDLWYMVFYVPKLRSRPAAEKRGLAIQWVIAGAAIAACVATGHGVDFLVVYLIPQRIAITFLGWAFDYLPHTGLHETPKGDKLKTTRNRVGHESLLSPLLLFQNYHLVHHLHPIVPFYRYIAVWRKNEDKYLEGDPALSTVGGRPLTADEYRELRSHAH